MICVLFDLILLVCWDLHEFILWNENALDFALVLFRDAGHDVSEEVESNAFESFRFSEEVAFFQFLEAVAVVMVDNLAFALGDEIEALFIGGWFLWLFGTCSGTYCQRSNITLLFMELLTVWRIQFSVLFVVSNYRCLMRKRG